VVADLPDELGPPLLEALVGGLEPLQVAQERLGLAVLLQQQGGGVEVVGRRGCLVFVSAQTCSMGRPT
jgi:hypothetical protein